MEKKDKKSKFPILNNLSKEYKENYLATILNLDKAILNEFDKEIKNKDV